MHFLHAILCLAIGYAFSALTASATPVVEVLYQFPNGTAVENSVILGNGSLIVSLASEPRIYRFDIQKPNPKPVLAYEFPDRTASSGLAQPAPNVLAVVAGNATGGLQPSGTHWAVFLLKLRGSKPASLIAKFEVPGAGLLNGMTSVPDRPHILLISDSILGLVWRLDTRTGALDQAFKDPLLAVSDPNGPPVGVNGVHVRGNALYFTNSNRAIFGRIGLVKNPVRPAGTAQVLGTATAVSETFDDFNFARDRTAYLANILAGEVTCQRPTPGAALEVVVGGLGGPTSLQVVHGVRYGYGGGPGLTLYVTTVGDITAPHGQVLRVRL